MLQLNKLEKITQKRKTIGRGGDRGGTSGRGHKGQKARSGGSVKAFFEGGQMPLSRRLPRRGFTNVFKNDVRVISLDVLEAKYTPGETVSKETLKLKGLVKGSGNFLVKILGSGTLTKKLTFSVDAISTSAAQAIKNAGGTIQETKEIAHDRATT
jgi:large subunit ribosomal protein L15